MTRPLAAVPPEPTGVLAALRTALAGDGPAVFVGHESPAPHVEQRIALVVQTSGSTGRPKRVALSRDAVLASAAAAESALGGPGQWLLALPVHYIAGINVLARSITAGTDPVLMDPEHFTAERFVEACAGLDPDARRYTSLVPAQLQRLLEADGEAGEEAVEALRRFHRILVGGQATPTALAARALELGLELTRTYGSAETCGGCLYDGVPIGDAAVRVVDGRVELAGPTLAEYYLDDPARTEAAFHIDDGRRWYRTDDLGVLDDTGALRITGRVDDVIITGGVKVSLGEVELLVRGLPGLGDAVVVAVDSEWGQSPVVVSAAAVDEDAVRTAVRDALGPQAVPLRIHVLDPLPRTPTGKPDRPAITAAIAG